MRMDQILKQQTRLKQLKLNEIQKSLWIKSSRKDFNTLDVVNNLDNNNYKTTVNNRAHDLKNTEKFLLELTKIGENETCELYDNLIKPDLVALEKAKSRNKYYNIIL